MKSIKLEEEEIFALILIHTAHQDFNFSEEEKTFIRSRTSEATFQRMLSIYQRLGSANTNEYLINYILKNKAHEVRFDEFKSEIIEQCLVDGEICKYEKSFLDHFDKIEKSL